uniref:Uncharacterized protein n=1 Tax=Anopheles melas TaxID=34690 RepID=A0A182TX48_9DIPT
MRLHQKPFLQSHTVTSSTAPHRNQVEDAPCANQGEAVSLFTPLQQLHEPRRHSLSPLIILLVGRLADDDDNNSSSSSNDIQQQQRPPFAITGRVVTLLYCTGARGLKGERPQLVLSGAPSALKLKRGKPQRTANATTTVPLRPVAATSNAARMQMQSELKETCEPCRSARPRLVFSCASLSCVHVRPTM